jgi:4-alpha-glucanotransferase
MRGRWVGVPTEKFFATLFKQIPSAPIIAEDLGYITADVREIITKFGFPCMKVLQFGFDGDLASNSHCPHNHIENCIVYTGTHDNNTTRGWFENEVGPNKRKKICEYLGHKISAESVHWEMIRLAMASVARIAIIPMQDVLGLPAKARMNHPARVRRNWLWRARQSQITPALAAKLKKMVETYGRG